MNIIVIWLIKLYRNYLSMLKLQCCRFYPSCSEYAIQSLEKHGLILGAYKSIKRLIRCNPFSKGGFDPA